MHTLPHETQLHAALYRSKLYRLLAQAFQYPRKQLLDFFSSSDFEDLVSSYVGEEDSRNIQQSIHLLREVVLKQTPEDTLKELESEYNRLFAHLGSAACPPYETEYGYDNIFQKTQAMADIAGFYRAYNLEVSDDKSERVDFLPTELEFMAYLTVKEAYALEHHEQEHLEICLDTQRKFIQDHFGRWVPLFSKILTKVDAGRFYLQCGEVLDEVLQSEITYLGVQPKVVTAPYNSPKAPLEPFGCGSCALAAEGMQFSDAQSVLPIDQREIGCNKC